MTHTELYARKKSLSIFFFSFLHQGTQLRDEEQLLEQNRTRYRDAASVKENKTVGQRER